MRTGSISGKGSMLSGSCRRGPIDPVTGCNPRVRIISGYTYPIRPRIAFAMRPCQGGCSKGQGPACEKMIHSGGYQAVRRTSPRRNASGDTVHMKNASFGGRTLARDSTFGARSYAWEVLRSRATRCGSCTIPVSEHLPAYLSTLLSSTAAAGPPRRRADSGGRKRQIVR